MYINLKKFKENHLVTFQKHPNKTSNTKEKSWKKSRESRSERRQREEHHEGRAFIIKAKTFSLAKKWDIYGKEIRKERLSGVHGRLFPNCFHDKLLSQHRHSSQAPEQDNSPPLSMGAGSNAFLTQVSSLTLEIFIISLIFILFSTEIMSVRLHTLMTPGIADNILNISMYLSIFIYFFMLECLLPLLALIPQYCPLF